MNHPIFKPKTNEEIDLITKRLEQQTDEFMTKIFNDLHKDLNDLNFYKNSKNEWMFVCELEKEHIWISYKRIWFYFSKHLIIDDKNISILIHNWLKQNTDWPVSNIRFKLM